MRPRRLAVFLGVAFLGLAFLGLALAGCGPQKPTRLPDVILISLDTLRRDAVGIYGGTHSAKTPELDALAHDSVVFEQAFVSMPFTLTSHLSMLTGLHPASHGVTHADHRLARGVATLPEQLHAAGYRTVGLVTNEWLKGDFGFDRGFDRYEVLPHHLTYADRVSAAALDAVDWAEPSRPPVFLFLHFMDAHSDFEHVAGETLPYYAPPSFLEGLDLPGARRAFCDEQGRCATEFLVAANREQHALSPERVALLHELYLRGIAYLDTELGRFFAALRERGLYESSLLILVSDHGEEFREHGELVHSQPYDETLAVPLIVKLPANRQAGRRVEGLVDLADLAPSILDVVGLDSPPGMTGHSLLPLINGEGRGRRFVLARDKNLPDRWALRSERWKLIVDEKSGRAELYDLEADPGEHHDLAAEQPERVATLTAQLHVQREHESRGASTASEGEVLTPEERERLRSLGYL